MLRRISIVGITTFTFAALLGPPVFASSKPSFPDGSGQLEAHASDGAVPTHASGGTSSRSLTAETEPSLSTWSTDLRGIDVSHWNGAIDWTKVAASGRSFAFLKATDGRTFDDPNYTTYRAGATAAGLLIGAYHFARPDSSAGDAVAEANHFVAVAGITGGMIIPVLDLETDGGLSTANLISWTKDWLAEVTYRTGVKPMIYTGPSRWSTEMGDTQWFADAGYRLWLAHWTTGSPWVPAGDWGGHGWTFWQWTDCGSVPGISGCVDLDHLHGTSLVPVTVRSVTVVRTGPGTVTSAPAGISCGTRCTWLFDPGSTVALTATASPGAVFVRWGGACSGDGSCSVTMTTHRQLWAVFGYALSASVSGSGTGTVTSSPVGIHCPTICSSKVGAGLSVTLSAFADPGFVFAGWSGACAGASTTCSVTMDGARSVGATFADDLPPTVAIQSPASITGAATATFSEVVHHVTPADFVLRASGSATSLPASITCVGGLGRAGSCAFGSVVRATLQPDAPLVPGEHYTVEVNPEAVSTPIVDSGGNPAPDTSLEFRAATSQQEWSAAASYAWGAIPSSNAVGGSYATEHLAGARVWLAFQGPAVTWLTVTGPGQGMGRVLIDGRAHGTFDLSGTTRHFRVARSFTGLGAGQHTLSVLVLGRSGATGNGTSVAVDGFRVGSTLAPAVDETFHWAARSASGAMGGGYATADRAGADVRFRFDGTGLDWVTMTGPDQGRTAIYVDGSLLRTVDGYSPTRSFGVVRQIRGLGDRVHVVRIVSLGTSRLAATGHMVSVDGWNVV